MSDPILGSFSIPKEEPASKDSLGSFPIPKSAEVTNNDPVIGKFSIPTVKENTLGINIPIVPSGPSTPLPEPKVDIPEPSFWKSVTETAGKIYDYVFDTTPSGEGLFSKYGGRPMTPKKQEILDKEKTALVEGLKKPEVHTGPFLPEAPALEIIKFATEHQPDLKLDPKAVDQQAALLGYAWTNKNGVASLEQIGKPAFTQPQISSIIFNTNKSVEEEQAKLQKEIAELKIENFMAGSINREQPDAKAHFAANRSAIEEKTKKIAELETKRQQAENFYGSIGRALNYAANTNPDFTVAADVLNQTPEGAMPDWEAYSNALNTTSKNLKSWSYNKEATVKQGNESLYLNDPYTVIGANVATSNPEGGIISRGLYKSTEAKSEYRGIYENYRSIKSTVDTDKKILEQLNNSISAILAEGAKNRVPPEVVEEAIIGRGLRDAVAATESYIASKENILKQYEARVSSGELESLAKFNATQEYQNSLLRDRGLIGRTAVMLNSASDALYDKLSHGLGDFLTWIGGQKDALSTSLYSGERATGILDVERQGEIFKQRMQTRSMELVPMEEKQLKDGSKITVPFYEKGAGIIDEYGNVSFNDINWDVLSYKGLSMAGEITAMVVGGEILNAPKIFNAATWADRGLAGADLAGSISVNATRGVTSDLAIDMAKVGYKTVKAGSKFVDATLGYAVPSMVVFSPDIIKAEMEHKSLSKEEAINLGMFRSLVEGYAFSVNPSGMIGATKRLFAGEVKNIAEDEAYKTLIETSWKKATGSELSDQAYRMLFDAAYHIPKGMAESAFNLTTQMNMALFANALISNGVTRKHPGYYSKEHELTPENIGNTTISALATSLPFGISHIYGSYKNSEHSRMSALYSVARNPEYYYNHIEGLVDRDLSSAESVGFRDKEGSEVGGREASVTVDPLIKNNGRISEEEGNRQKALVMQATEALASIADRIKKIEDRTGLTPQEKHSMQFELFKEAINEKGIVDNLAKEITDAEREKLLESLKESTDRATRIYEYKGMLEAASPEERMQIEADAAYSTFVDTFLNPQLRKVYTIKDYEERVKDLANLISKETNPYLSAKYLNLMEGLNLFIADFKYQESNSPEHLQEHVSNLVDWIDEKTLRAMEELDLKKRSGDELFHNMTPEEEFQFVQQFVEDDMSVSQKALYEQRRDLVNDEIYKRMGDITPVPTDGPVDEVSQDSPTPPQTPPSRPEEDSKDSSPVIEDSFKKELFDEIAPGEDWGVEEQAKLENWLKETGQKDVAGLVKGMTPEESKQVYLAGKMMFEPGKEAVAKSILDKLLDRPTPTEVIKARQAEQTEDYIRIQDSPADVARANYTGLATFNKLVGMDMINEDGIGLVPDPHNPGNLLLVDAVGLLAYVGREAEETPKGWKLKNNEFYKPYEMLQSARYFQPGTELTIRVNSIQDSPYAEKAMEQFKAHAAVLVEDYGIPQSDIDKVLSNPDRFRLIEAVSEEGLAIPLHGPGYLTDSRIAGMLYLSNGDVINNLRQQFYAMMELNDKLIAAHSRGETLKTKIVATTFGHPIKDAQGKSLPVKEVYKNPDILKNIQIVKKPDEVYFNKKRISNWEGMTPGRPAGAFPTSKKDVRIGLHFNRAKVSPEEARSVINAINLYVEYEAARVAGDKETMDKLRAISDEFAQRSDDPYRYAIHELVGVQWYLNNLVYAMENTSKFKAPGQERADLANVPFIDIDLKDGTITFSDKRLLGHLQPYEPIVGFEALKKANIHRQLLLIDGKPNPNNKYFLDKFERFLLSRPKDFKQEKVKSITGKFELPLLDRDENGYRLLDEPKEAKNKGTSYHDYMLNNLTTTYREFQITHSDGEIEHVYFEQPNKQLDLKFESDKPQETDGLLSVIDFYKRLKEAKTLSEAQKLIKESPPYPGIQPSIDSILESLRKTATYEEKEAEFNTAWRKHNELTARVSDFNSLRKKKQESNDGVKAERLIHQMAGEMGYTLKKDPKTKSKTKYIALTPSGAAATKKSFPAKPLDIKDGKISWSGLEVGKEDAFPFLGVQEFETNVMHLDYGLTNARLKKGFDSINKGDLTNLSAQAILKKIATWKSQGYVEFIQGSGAHINRDTVPFDDYIAKATETASKLKEANEEIAALSEEEFNNIVEEYDAWFDSLSPEEQEKHNEQYEQINTDSETEGGLYEEESDTGELPEKTGISETGTEVDKDLESTKENVSLPTDVKDIEDFILDNRPFAMRPRDEKIAPPLKTEISKSEYRSEVAEYYAKLSKEEKANVGSLEALLEKYQGWSDEDIIKEIDCIK